MGKRPSVMKVLVMTEIENEEETVGEENFWKTLNLNQNRMVCMCYTSAVYSFEK